MRIRKLVGIILLITIWGCHNSKPLTNRLEDTLLLNNKNIIRNYFDNKKLNVGLFDVNKQRKYIINSLSLNELESDTLIIYETYLSNASASYKCVVFNSKSQNFRVFSEESRLLLTKDDIKLDPIEDPSPRVVCLINRVREEGIYDWDRSYPPYVGGIQYYLLTLAIKNTDKEYELTSYEGIRPPIDCK